MTTIKPLNEGNTRNVQKGKTVNPKTRPNVKPTAPPPAPTPRSDGRGSNSSGK